MKRRRVELKNSRYVNFLNALESGDLNRCRKMLGLRRARNTKKYNVIKQAIELGDVHATAAGLVYLAQTRPCSEHDILQDLAIAQDLDFSRRVAREIDTSKVKFNWPITSFLPETWGTWEIRCFWYFSVFGRNPKNVPHLKEKWLDWKPTQIDNARMRSFAFERCLISLLFCLRGLSKDMRYLISIWCARMWWHNF